MKGYPQESAIIPKFKCIWIHRFDVVDKYSYKQFSVDHCAVEQYCAKIKVRLSVLLFKNFDFCCSRPL